MEISSKRLRLREFVAADWEAVLAYQQKPAYLHYYPWTARSATDVQHFVQPFIDQQNATPRSKFQLAIELKENGQLIGNCGLRLDSAESHKATIGYELDPAFWGNGYATEAVRILLKLGFSQFGLHRISAECLAVNSGSIRVLEKVGMIQEGRLHDAEFFKGRYWDVLLYGLIR